MLKHLLLLTVIFAGIIPSCIQLASTCEKTFPVVINEFMTSNRTDRYCDEYGDPDDWIELYNGGTEAYAVGAFSLSDDSTRPYLFTLPDTLLPPGGFLVIWADNEPSEGVLHAPFVLSSQNGDEIVMTDSSGTVVDRIQFFPHNDNPVARVPDESYGRETDGGEIWVQQESPTPGAPNTGRSPQ